MDSEERRRSIEPEGEGYLQRAEAGFLPESSRSKPKEMELTYESKESETDVIANTMSLPFQMVKKLGEIAEGQWVNRLVFGDNLQALRSMMDDNDVKGKVKLIYIDPPFATEAEFRSSQGALAYQDRVNGALFVEALRKRLILLRELLASNGVIFVHLDYRKVHYIKVVMDEVFGDNNFVNEIAVRRIKKNVREREKVRRVNVGYDQILVYANSPSTYINPPLREERRPDRWHSFEAAGIRTGMDYELFGKKPKPGNHWRWTQQRAKQATREEILRPNERTGVPEYLVRASEYAVCDSLWDDITAYSFKWSYPTEKKEDLLARIIEIGSDEGDLVLDCFSGSGTTGAVAEKLKRKWIMVDSSKLAIYTAMRRMLSLRSGSASRSERRFPRPFAVYNVGLYENHGRLLELPPKEYREFALKLFQIDDWKHDINGLSMDGVLMNCPAKVLTQDEYVTEEFIRQLHDVVGDYIGDRMFLIAPVGRVYFLQNYVEMDSVRYYVLRVPYSIIEEIHRRSFSRPLQPVSNEEVNNLVDSVGFDFMRAPFVKAQFTIEKPQGKLTDYELVIRIEELRSDWGLGELAENDALDALSMVMIDYDYNGHYFSLSSFWFREDLKDKNWTVEIDAAKLGSKIMVVYLDVVGNEAIEIVDVLKLRGE